MRESRNSVPFTARLNSANTRSEQSIRQRVLPYAIISPTKTSSQCRSFKTKAEERDEFKERKDPLAVQNSSKQ